MKGPWLADRADQWEGAVGLLDRVDWLKSANRVVSPCAELLSLLSARRRLSYPPPLNLRLVDRYNSSSDRSFSLSVLRASEQQKN